MSNKVSFLRGIGGKVLSIFLILSFIAIILVTSIAILMSSRALLSKSYNQLEAVQKIKKSQIMSFFSERMGDINVFSINRSVMNALIQFKSAFEEEGDKVGGEKWNEINKKYGHEFEYYMEQYGYYDVFLIAKDGDVIYTVSKEKDLGENLISGKLSDSGLAHAFKKGLEKANFTDFQWYDVSNEPASFIASPVKDENGNLVGVLAFQISLKAINNIMQEREGLGKTGETYLVGSDKRMRSDSYLDPIGHSVKASFEGTVEKNGVDTEAVREGLAGRKGKKVITDYNGNPVLSVWDPFKLGDTTWVVLAEIDQAEVFQPIISLILVIAGLALFVLITVSIVSIVFSQSIASPIKLVTEGAQRFAVGDIELQGMDWDKIKRINKRSDELGEIGRAFIKLIDYFKNKVGLAKEIAKGNLDIEVDISSNADQLGIALNDTVGALNDVLAQVNASVNQVSSGSLQVSSASQQLSQGATEQASSLEEITSSITEINSQSKQNAESATNANNLANTAKDTAREGNDLMNNLVEAMTQINERSEEIKKIVKVIDDIAFQTNLLALNANVEAARAGKYGKGFAVVAEEVRNLASRSAGAVKETTDMVEDTIKSISSSNELVEKTAKQLEEIVKGSEEVVQLVEEIALASKEQAQGLDQVNIGLGQIDQVTQANTASAEESASAAEELASQAEILKSMVSTFNLKQLIQDEVNQKMLDQIKSSETFQRVKDTHLKTLGNGKPVKTNKVKKENIKEISKDIKKKTKEDDTIVDTVSLDDQNFGKF